MNAVVFQHVPVAELPAAWREKLGQDPAAHVTVRIEQETEAFETDDPAFGIWRDREDVSNPEDYVRRLRAPRFDVQGLRKER